MKKTKDEDVFVEEGEEDEDYGVSFPGEDQKISERDDEMSDFFPEEDEEESF